jgi:hypothetical protein
MEAYIILSSTYLYYLGGLIESNLSRIPPNPGIIGVHILENILNALAVTIPLVYEFYQYMKSIGTSENYQNVNLKILIYFGRFLGPTTDFYSIQKKEQILSFLDTRIKDSEIDPDKRWIRTWNDYLQRIKYFFRWLYNKREQELKGLDVLPQSDWKTPSFIQITEKRTKRISPYLETELWERDEILTIIKYEPYKRNKAALSLLWDLDARNHEVTLLKIKHIRLKDVIKTNLQATGQITSQSGNYYYDFYKSVG